MQKFFGTDGIRGKVGDPPMTADFILKLGWAVGMMLAQTKDAKTIIGKDTRLSGYMFEAALQAGLAAAGAEIYLLGPMPTPGIAYMTQAFRGDIGIVISASHNLYEDNGIKFFSTAGYKISKEVEQTIEYWLSQPIKTLHSQSLGKARRIDDAQGRYIEFCKSSVPHNTQFDHLKIVVDCANGATYHVAPYVFSELGADVIPIFITPDGMNINLNCGSVHPESLRQRVIQEKADVGIGFDGDGDRLVLVDERGEVLDGDEILFVIARTLMKANRFTGGVVGTEMSNKGLEIALNDLGLHFTRVPVGDQNVIQELSHKKWVLGGETSGHIMYLNTTTTADGIIAALQVIYAICSTGQSLFELKQGMIKNPQRLISIPHYGHKIDLESASKLEVEKVTKKLGKTGRVSLRYSGTEPLIRIMVEGEDPSIVNECTEDLKLWLENQVKQPS